MVTYVCDNKEIEDKLKKLESLITANGGGFDENLQVHCENGYFSLRAPVVKDHVGERLVKLSEACLIPIDMVEWGVEDGKIVAGASDTDLSALRREILDIILDLYNMTAKLESHRESCLWYALRSKGGILDAIVKGRASSAAQEFMAHIRAGSFEQLLVDSFIKSRCLSYKMHDDGKATKVLMPFIDFMNHHMDGALFANDKLSGGGVHVGKSWPQEGTDECFVYYNTFDAYDSWLFYGYADDSASFLRSVPYEINIPQVGKIDVLAFPGVRYKTEDSDPLPPHVGDLVGFMPNIKAEREGYLAVDFLQIPYGHSPRALRRVLSFLIKKLAPDMSDAVLQSHVVQAESSVIYRNILFYEDLEGFLKRHEGELSFLTAVIDGHKMVRLQLDKLRSYPFLSAASRAASA